MFDDPKFLRTQLTLDRAALAQAESNLETWTRLGKMDKAAQAAKDVKFWKTECAEAETKLASFGLRV